MSNHQELFENIAKFISNSRNLLEQDAMVEMAGLDNQVQELCEKILNLSGEEQTKYADSLQHLLNELTLLGNDLTSKREEIASEMRDISNHKKANVAYKTADAKGSLTNESGS